MNDFFSASGHLDWGVFALVVFTGVWFLLFDLVWRLSNVGIGRLVVAMSVGWVVGLGLVWLTLYR